MMDDPRVEAQCVFNLLVATYALADHHAMMTTFTKLLDSRDRVRQLMLCMYMYICIVTPSHITLSLPLSPFSS